MVWAGAMICVTCLMVGGLLGSFLTLGRQRSPSSSGMRWSPSTCPSSACRAATWGCPPPFWPAPPWTEGWQIHHQHIAGHRLRRLVRRAVRGLRHVLQRYVRHHLQCADSCLAVHPVLGRHHAHHGQLRLQGPEAAQHRRCPPAGHRLPVRAHPGHCPQRRPVPDRRVSARGQHGLVFGINYTIATFALGGVIAGDYCRFAKSRKDVIKSSFLGVIPAGFAS